MDRTIDDSLDDCPDGFSLSFDPELSFSQMLGSYVALETFYRACGSTTPLPCNIVMDPARVVSRGEVEGAIAEYINPRDRPTLQRNLDARFPRATYGFTYPAAQVMHYLQNNALEELVTADMLVPAAVTRELVQDIPKEHAEAMFYATEGFEAKYAPDAAPKSLPLLVMKFSREKLKRILK